MSFSCLTCVRRPLDIDGKSTWHSFHVSMSYFSCPTCMYTSLVVHSFLTPGLCGWFLSWEDKLAFADTHRESLSFQRHQILMQSLAIVMKIGVDITNVSEIWYMQAKINQLCSTSLRENSGWKSLEAGLHHHDKRQCLTTQSRVQRAVGVKSNVRDVLL